MIKTVNRYLVDKRLNKYEIKRMIGELFDVHVVSIRTISEHGEIKKNMMRRKKVIKPSKKAIVTLREKEKIALFDTKD